MPVHQLPSVKGDLYVRFIVVLPTKLYDEEKKIIKNIFG